jgi:hypothetical protein
MKRLSSAGLDQWTISCLVTPRQLVGWARTIDAPPRHGWTTSRRGGREIQAIDPKLFTEHFRRVWTYYLSGVIENFRHDLNLHHITFTKGKGQS